jgi:hypothetical protein
MAAAASSSSSSSPSAEFQHVLHQLRNHATTEVKLKRALSAAEVTLLCEALSVSSTHTAGKNATGAKEVQETRQRVSMTFVCLLAVDNERLLAFAGIEQSLGDQCGIGSGGAEKLAVVSDDDKALPCFGIVHSSTISMSIAVNCLHFGSHQVHCLAACVVPFVDVMQ